MTRYYTKKSLDIPDRLQKYRNILHIDFLMEKKCILAVVWAMYRVVLIPT